MVRTDSKTEAAFLVSVLVAWKMVYVQQYTPHEDGNILWCHITTLSHGG